jgi:hypothetical protein
MNAVQAMAHPTHEGVEVTMDESNVSQPIRLGSRSLCGNALPFSIGKQIPGAELGDAALGVSDSRDHDVFLSAMSRSSRHRSH